MKSHFSLILTLTACAVLLAACSWLGVSALNQRPAAISAAMFSGPTAEELAAALIRAGLDPEALAAAEVDPEDVAIIVDDVREELIASNDALALADASYTTAKQTHDPLQRLIRSGQADQEDLTAFSTAASQLATASANRQAALDDLHGAGVATLTTTQKNILATIRANRAADWDVPIHFMVVERTEPQWVQLREALANERISEALGEEPDSAAQTFLQQQLSVTAVANAAAFCDTSLQFVQSEWDSAIAE